MRRPMKRGKVSESVLKRSVFKYIPVSETVIKGAAIGSDCAFLQWEKEGGGKAQTAVSAQTVAFPIKDGAKLAIYGAVNNLAAGGAEPRAVVLALTLPEKMEEAELKELMKQAGETGRRLGLAIAGGHTEVTGQVRAPVVTAAALGVPREEDFSAGTGSGADIVMTKWAGLQGTLVLAGEKEEELLSRYPMGILTAAKGFEKYSSVVPEAATALKSGVYAMHDAGNGGVFGALWELSESMGVGLTIDLKKIPIRQETVEICEFYGLNPYMLHSGGVLLAAALEGEKLVRELAEKGIFACVIGRTTDSNDRVLLNEEEVRYLEPGGTDELYQILF